MLQEKRYSHIINYNSFQILPERLKSKLNISGELFKKEDIYLVASHQENLNHKNLDYTYCFICQKNNIPMLLEKYKEKLTDNPKINYRIDNWGTLDVPTNF